jgi:hypothetical protein
MVSRQSEYVTARRAAALKQNLKRRKNQARAKATTETETTAPNLRGLGTAPGLENEPPKGPQPAAKAE